MDFLTIFYTKLMKIAGYGNHPERSSQLADGSAAKAVIPSLPSPCTSGTTKATTRATTAIHNM